MSNVSTATASSNAAGAAVVLVGRVLLSILFIFAGFGKLTDISGTAGWFGSIGLPLPVIAAVVIGLLEFFGGLAILVGFKTRIAAIAIAVFTVAATLIAHTNFADQVQLLFFLKNVSITGGLLVLAAFGPGALSIDARRG
ncbi:DoxX family protein [Mesorhizobium sp. LHD-90]|uniref:DoxX family protein n=1 Tax=Mesorhizobium sp. LHD-90 TaxID=3071414 RepID=UPI0027E14054|nr:DoxX family protein [Mesorhizobium sp. LHD-90]MDQ6435073.1 DoxX family protein [Mesorhizobium sp. LHD-90]